MIRRGEALSESPADTPWCPTQTCQRWEAMEELQSACRLVHVEIYSSSVVHRRRHTDGLPISRESAGIRWVCGDDVPRIEARGESDACAPPGTTIRSGDGMWVEVARKSLGGELTGGAGMWFAVAHGTGVWVEAKRVWPVVGYTRAGLETDP